MYFFELKDGEFINAEKILGVTFNHDICEDNEDDEPHWHIKYDFERNITTEDFMTKEERDKRLEDVRNILKVASYDPPHGLN